MTYIAAEPEVRTSVQVAPARFVTVHLASAITGLSEAAIRNKVVRGLWVEGRHYVKRDGRILIDLKGYEKWVVQGE